MLDMIFSLDFLDAILRATTPILFATLASGIAAKSGLINMALEGIMLFSALFGVIFTSITQDFVSGLLLTVLMGGLFGCVLAIFILKLKTDQILTAIAFNLMATGGTVIILLAFSGDRGSSLSISSVAAPKIIIPLIDSIPIVGSVLSGQSFLTYFAFFSVVIIHLLLYKTPLGLSIRSVGENQHAAESVGINPHKVQYIAMIISGMLASMGGFYLSGGYMNVFTKDMTAGRGFIALAASAMGGNTPIGGMVVSVLFGLSQSYSNLMQLSSQIPHELIQMVPYLTTLIGLGIYSYWIMNKKKHAS